MSRACPSCQPMEQRGALLGHAEGDMGRYGVRGQMRLEKSGQCWVIPMALLRDGSPRFRGIGAEKTTDLD